MSDLIKTVQSNQDGAALIACVIIAVALIAGMTIVTAVEKWRRR